MLLSERYVEIWSLVCLEVVGQPGICLHGSRRTSTHTHSSRSKVFDYCMSEMVGLLSRLLFVAGLSAEIWHTCECGAR